MLASVAHDWPAEGTMKPLLTVEELSEKLQLSVSTLYRLARANKIPTVRLTARVLFDEDAVAEALRGVSTPTAVQEGREP
jgi:excisionase family DNA binding protein